MLTPHTRPIYNQSKPVTLRRRWGSQTDASAVTTSYTNLYGSAIIVDPYTMDDNYRSRNCHRHVEQQKQCQPFVFGLAFPAVRDQQRYKMKKTFDSG